MHPPKNSPTNRPGNPGAAGMMRILGDPPTNSSCQSYISVVHYPPGTSLGAFPTPLRLPSSRTEKIVRNCSIFVQCKSFVCNTYGSPRKCCKQKTYGAAKFFRCNTYKKHRGWGHPVWLLVSACASRKIGS